MGLAALLHQCADPARIYKGIVFRSMQTSSCTVHSETRAHCLPRHLSVLVKLIFQCLLGEENVFPSYGTTLVADCAGINCLDVWGGEQHISARSGRDNCVNSDRSPRSKFNHVNIANHMGLNISSKT